MAVCASLPDGGDPTPQAPGGMRPRLRIAAEVAIILAYAAFVFTGAWAHEPWFDEAQSWLLARDVAPVDLIAHHLRYEGHPPLWYLLLRGAMTAGLRYDGLNHLSAAIALLGVILLVRLRAIPLVLRTLLPFTYFVAWQYAVIARSYVLALPILLAIAAIYHRRTERLLTFTALLVVLANVSVHLACVAAALVALYALDVVIGAQPRPPLGRTATAALLFLTNALFLLLILRVPPDLYIAKHLDFEFRLGDMLRVGWKALANGFFGANWLSALLLIIVGAWLFTTRSLRVLLLPLLALLPVYSIYRNAWHEGLFILVFLFAVAVAFQAGEGREETKTSTRRTTYYAACTVLTIFAVRQIAWTVATFRYDLGAPYSGAPEAARYIHQHDLIGGRLFAFGFGTVALQPYFDRNLFANARGSSTFWDWSVRNPLIARPSVVERPIDRQRWMAAMLAQRPDYFLVSRKFEFDDYRRELLEQAGFRPIATFPGALFWKDHIYEREDFVLYRAPAVPGASSAPRMVPAGSRFSAAVPRATKVQH
jgi:hypothetical protein